MLNKKAIAAFAAGATLLSGMAFAAPAFAADAPKGDQKTEQKADNKAAIAALESKIESAKKAKADAEQEVKDAKKALDKAGLGDLDEKEQAVEKAKKAVEKAKADHAAYKAAEKTKKDAESAFTKYVTDVKALFADSTTLVAASVTQANVTALTKAGNADQSKFDAAKAQLKALVGTITGAAAKLDALTDGNVSAAESELETAQDTLDEYKNGAYADLVKALNDAKDKVATQQTLLDSYNAQLAALKGEKPAPKPEPKPEPKPVPQTPASDPFNFLTDALDPTTQSQAIDYVRFAAMNLQNAENNHAVKLKAYQDARKALLAAEAEFNARTAAAAAAKQALTDFLAKGATDSATETKLSDAVDRANAHVVRATKALADALAKFEAARKDAFASVAAYNHALSEYKRLYNKAIEMGVNPALLPPVKTADPLTPNFPDITSAKELYAQALSGKFGKDAQAAAEKCGKACGADKKADAKKCADKAAPLAKTGAAVALAAVAASVLAGMGAALRKIRH